MKVLSAKGLSRTYLERGKGGACRALDSVSLEIEAGEFAAVMGPSGSGKTTLLAILALLDRPDSGELSISGADALALRGDALAAFRRERLGFVFQDSQLIDTMTLAENALLPLALGRCPGDEAAARLDRLSWRLGIEGLLGRYPSEVSGGQRQRAAAFFSRGLLAELLILPAFAAAQIAFRSRRNARLLALCSVLVGMASSAAGTVATMALRAGQESSLGQDELYGALLFIGSFLALAFALSAAALLASRASADARDDAARRDSFRKLGAARGDIRRSIARQNAFFFGLPALFGIAHSAAAMTMLRTFSGYPTIGPAAATGAATGTLIALAAAASTARQMESLLDERDDVQRATQQAKEPR